MKERREQHRKEFNEFWKEFFEHAHAEFKAGRKVRMREAVEKAFYEGRAAGWQAGFNDGSEFSAPVQTELMQRAEAPTAEREAAQNDEHRRLSTVAVHPLHDRR